VTEEAKVSVVRRRARVLVGLGSVDYAPLLVRTATGRKAIPRIRYSEGGTDHGSG
jgi:hypothetical protein